MTEPGDPKPEYHLNDTDRELIKAVDFHLTADLTALSGMFSLVELDGVSAVWPREKLEAFRKYFAERSQEVRDHHSQFQSSTNPDIHSLGIAMNSVAEQLISLFSIIGTYLRDNDLGSFQAACTDTIARMEPSAEVVRNNRAYRAYKDYMNSKGLDKSRNTFIFP